MPVYGKIIVIKRNGSDGSAFPLISNTCLIGRDAHCDIRIQLDVVSQEHSRLDVKPDGQILLTNLSKLNPTTLNHHPVKNSVHVCHMDIISVADRSLRWEFPANSQYYNSQKQVTPLKDGSPNSPSRVLTSATKLSPESKSPPLVDHRSFKVTLGTPRFSPGRKSLQKPLSGKKVPFFLSPGKHTPKKRLSLKSHGYLSPEKAIIHTPSPKIHSAKKASPKTNAKSPTDKLPSPVSRKSASPLVKKASPKAENEASPTLKSSPKHLTVKTPSPRLRGKASVTPSLKSTRKSSPVARKKTLSPTSALKKTPSPPSALKKTPSPPPALKKTPSPPSALKKTPSPPSALKKTLSPTTALKKTPSPKTTALKKTPSPKTTALKKTPSPKTAAKKTPSPTTLKNSPKTPSSNVRALRFTTPTSDAKKSPQRTPQSVKKTPVRRASDSGLISRGRRSLLKRSVPSRRSMKVSFGPNLSPEQFDKALPPTTPLRKGGRPKRGSSMVPNYYGSPIISPGRSKRSVSPAAVISPNAKRIRAEKDPATVSPVKSSPGKSSPGTNSLKKTAKSSKLAQRKSSLNILSPSSLKVLDASLKEENVVKIFSPESPDSKKLAALRTIHAKLVFNKTSKKSGSPSLSTTAKRKLLSKSPRSLDSSMSEFTELKGRRTSPQKSIHSAPRLNRRATLEPLSANTSFDAQTFQTPNGPTEMFVSPMTEKRGSSPSFLLKRLINASPSARSKSARSRGRLSGEFPRAVPMKKKSRFPVKSPKSDYTNVEGVKRLMKSPRKSPRSDYTDVKGVKRLMKSPRKSPKSDYTDVTGVERIFRQQKSPKSDYTDVTGVERIFRQQKSPRSDYSNVEGLERLMKTPEQVAPPPSVKLYPERRNKLEPVDYLGFKKEKSPRKSKSPPSSTKKTQRMGSVLKTISPSSGSRSALKRMVIGSPVLSSALKKLSAGGSPVLKRSSAGGSPVLKRSSAGGSPALKRSSAGGSPALKRSSAGGSPALKRSSVGGSPVLKRSSAGGSTVLKRSSAGGSPVLKRSSASGSPVLKRSSVKKSSPPQSGLSTSQKSGGRRSRTSFSPELNKLFLTPVISKLRSPVKKLTPSPSKYLSSKTPLADMPLNTSPVTSVAKSSGNKKLRRTARSTKTAVKYSPGTQRVKREVNLVKSSPQFQTPRNSPEKALVEAYLAKSVIKRKSPEMALVEACLAKSPSPVKGRRGKPRKAVEAGSPGTNKENAEPLVASPKIKSVGRTRRALVTSQGSPAKSEAILTMVSPKKYPASPVVKASPAPSPKKTKATRRKKGVIVTPRRSSQSPVEASPPLKKYPASPVVKASPALSPKKTKATRRKKVVIVTPRRSSQSPVEASPPLIARKTRGRSKKPSDAASSIAEIRVEPVVASPKKVAPPKRMRKQVSTPKPDSPEKSPSPVAVRKTRTKTSKAKASPEKIKSPIRKTRKTAVKSEESATPTAPKGRSGKRKAVDEVLLAPESPKVNTPVAVAPKKTRRGAAKKASPTKEQSPKASPVALRKKASSKMRSPAKTAVATRSSKRTRK